jgi:hypothetical protein
MFGPRAVTWPTSTTLLALRIMMFVPHGAGLANELRGTCGLHAVWSESPYILAFFACFAFRYSQINGLQAIVCVPFAFTVEF